MKTVSQFSTATLLVAGTAVASISMAGAAFVPSTTSCQREASAFPFITGKGPSASFSPLRAATLDGVEIDKEFTPINNFLLVKCAVVKEETDGGIILTGKQKVEKTEGEVISVGPGRTFQDTGVIVPMPVKTGDRVNYVKYGGTELTYNGSKHKLISDNDIVCKFTGDELTMENAEMVFDNVLVKVEEKEDDESTGGILLAKTSKGRVTKPSTGEVVKVGPGKTAINGAKMEMEVKVGDFIKFRDFAGEKVNIEGRDYSAVRMVDILARF